MAAEKENSGKESFDLSAWWKHDGVTRAWKEALKVAGIGFGMIVAAPTILCCATGIVVPSYISAGAAATVTGARWVKKLEKRPRASAPDGSH